MPRKVANWPNAWVIVHAAQTNAIIEGIEDVPQGI